MKLRRILAVSLALVCLCGCGSKGDAASSAASTEEAASTAETTASETTASETASTENSSSESELKAVFEKISESVELPDMVELNDNLLQRYYGLSTDAVADYAGGVDSSGVGQDEIALFKAADETQVDVIAQALNTRYESKLSQQENYNPDEAEKIRNCSVTTNGMYVTLIISNDAEQITEIVNSSIG